MIPVKTYRSKWRQEWSDRYPALAGAFSSALGHAEGVPRRAADLRAELAKPGLLTDRGLAQACRTKLRAELTNQARADAVRARATLEAERQAHAAARAKLLSFEIDRTDVVAELQRRELRDWIRGMQPGDALRTVMEDRLAAEAVLTAPPAFKLIPDTARDRVAEHHAQQTHGAALAELEEREEALLLASFAIDGVHRALRDAAELSPTQFDVWLATGVDPDTQPSA